LKNGGEIGKSLFNPVVDDRKDEQRPKTPPPEITAPPQEAEPKMEEKKIIKKKRVLTDKIPISQDAMGFSTTFNLYKDVEVEITKPKKTATPKQHSYKPRKPTRKLLNYNRLQSKLDSFLNNNKVKVP